jgi:hypothetical protein
VSSRLVAVTAATTTKVAGSSSPANTCSAIVTPLSITTAAAAAATAAAAADSTRPYPTARIARIEKELALVDTSRYIDCLRLMYRRKTSFDTDCEDPVELRQMLDEVDTLNP